MVIDGDFDGASLLDLGVRLTRWGDWRFAPALLWTPDGWGDGVPPERLRDHSTAHLPLGVRPDAVNVLEQVDGLWVRARLPVALGFAPPTCRRKVDRRRLLDAGMLAVSDDPVPRVTPFVVTTDWEVQAELRFGPGCPADRRRAIAAAFWGLLASAPAALANYRDRFVDGYDVSAYGATVGCRRGQFYLLSRDGW